MAQHPFAGSKGRARRDTFAARLFAEQGGKCQGCATSIDPTLRGTRDPRSAVIDHITPWKLRPDLSYSYENLQLVCRDCHATLTGLEKRHWPSIPAILQAKRAMKGVGLDGWPIG